MEPRSQNDDEFLSILKYYFTLFLEYTKNRWITGELSDINKFKKFEQFHNTIDKISSEIKLKNPIQYSKINAKLDTSKYINLLGVNVDKNDITYIDDNIAVIRADYPHKSITYGNKFSDWCTSRKQSNLFYSYRLSEDPETMYFVYMLKKDPKDPELVLHFGVNDEDEISYTDRNNNEMDKDLDWLGNKFPEIKPAIESGAFKFIPPTNDETKVARLPNNISDYTFNYLTNTQRHMWILTGHRKLTTYQWDALQEDSKNTYIRDFVDNDVDLQDELLNHIVNTKYFNLYLDTIEDRLRDKLNSGDDVYITPDEYFIIGFRKLNNVLSYLSKRRYEYIILGYPPENLYNNVDEYRFQTLMMVMEYTNWNYDNVRNVIYRINSDDIRDKFIELYIQKSNDLEVLLSLFSLTKKHATKIADTIFNSSINLYTLFEWHVGNKVNISNMVHVYYGLLQACSDKQLGVDRILQALPNDDKSQHVGLKELVVFGQYIKEVLNSKYFKPTSIKLKILLKYSKNDKMVIDYINKLTNKGDFKNNMFNDLLNESYKISYKMYYSIF